MQVAPEGVTIWATARAGLFYGIQSLLQLLPAGAGVVADIPAILVSRAPEVQGIGFRACCSCCPRALASSLNFRRFW